MTSKIVYKGNLRTELTHLQSGQQVETDAPTDNHGKGERFSPTDLVATGLAACMLTTVGIKAEGLDLSIEGSYAEVTKIMKADPRRIAQIDVHLYFSKGISEDPKIRTILENTAKACPVAKSLHPDLQQNVEITWL